MSKPMKFLITILSVLLLASALQMIYIRATTEQGYNGFKSKSEYTEWKRLEGKHIGKGRNYVVYREKGRLMFKDEDGREGVWK
jgi:hypothetical protein